MSPTTPITPTTPTTPSTQTQYKDAGTPFNSPDADIIIRSSDGRDFRVHRLILGLASVTFKDMFAAQPQPALPDASVAVSDDFKDGIPVVRLTESSDTLRIFFKLLYPGDPPKISGRAVTVAIVKAMDKYMVEDYPKTITSALLALSDEAPHVVLAFAFRHNVALQVREAAAHSTLKLPAVIRSNPFPDDELELLTIKQYHEILVYHQRCTAVASMALDTLKWATKDWAEVACGREKSGGVLYWASTSRSPSGCICARTLRRLTVEACHILGESKRWERKSSKPKEISIPVAVWATEFIAGCQAALWVGPHWDIVANASVSSAVEQARRCSICGPKAEGELKNIAEHLAGAVKMGIEKVRPLLLAFHLACVPDPF